MVLLFASISQREISKYRLLVSNSGSPTLCENVLDESRQDNIPNDNEFEHENTSQECTVFDETAGKLNLN